MTVRVLVVDDSVSDREVVKGMLRHAGHEVVGEAASGEQALSQYQALSPDVVIMDLVMPQMNGCDAARAILRTDPQARIIAMSGLSQPSVQGEAEDAGVLSFVPKPIEAEDLLAEVEDAMRGTS